MFGLFGENGPLRVTRTGPNAGDLVVGVPAIGGSWVDDADVIFVD